MRILTFLVTTIALLLAHGKPVSAQPAATESAINDPAPLLLMPDPPVGFVVQKLPIVAEGKLLGYQIQATREDSVSKVIVKVELADRSTTAARRAAAKAYVNGFATEMQNAGLQLSSKDIPDIDKTTFDKPVVIGLQFSDDQQSTLRIRKRLLFDERGYDIMTVAFDEADFKMLNEWADHITLPK